jgi:hypothetical protein
MGLGIEVREHDPNSTMAPGAVKRISTDRVTMEEPLRALSCRLQIGAMWPELYFANVGATIRLARESWRVGLCRTITAIVCFGSLQG